MLARNAPGVLSRAQVLDRIWEDRPGVEPNVLDICIGELKEDRSPRRAWLIHTIRGVGYTLRPAYPCTGSRSSGGWRSSMRYPQRLPWSQWRWGRSGPRSSSGRRSSPGILCTDGAAGAKSSGTGRLATDSLQHVSLGGVVHPLQVLARLWRHAITSHSKWAVVLK